jgi:hypothetical protein
MANMTMFSGKSFDPECPKSTQIELLDIAVALSRIPRFTGHTAFPYSVAQHSMLVADLIKQNERDPDVVQRLQILAMLHDADEAYTSDIPSPVKQLLKPTISQIEHKIMTAIYRHFNIEPPTKKEQSILKYYDILAFEIENTNLRNETTYISIGNPFTNHNVNPFIDSHLVALVFMREFKRLQNHA